MWGTALITLFPGNFVSGVLVDKLFWKSTLTAVEMSVVDVPVELAINASVWFLCAKLLRLVKYLRKPHSLVLAVLLGACTLSWAEDRTATAPKNADRIVIVKSTRTLTLLNHDHVLRTYQVALGGDLVGPKIKAGDKKTPEGEYVIDSKNPHSRFHLALHISYPNAAARERARKLGVSPGGGVEIHGLDPKFAWVGSLQRQINWTAGCIAVTNPEIEEIYKLVPLGNLWKSVLRKRRVGHFKPGSATRLCLLAFTRNNWGALLLVLFEKWPPDRRPQLSKLAGRPSKAVDASNGITYATDWQTPPPSACSLHLRSLCRHPCKHWRRVLELSRELECHRVQQVNVHRALVVVMSLVDEDRL